MDYFTNKRKCFFYILDITIEMLHHRKLKLNLTLNNIEIDFFLQVNLAFLTTQAYCKISARKQLNKVKPLQNK